MRALDPWIEWWKVQVAQGYVPWQDPLEKGSLSADPAQLLFCA